MFDYEVDLVDKFLDIKKNKENFIRECPLRWGNIDVVEYQTESINHLTVSQIKILMNKENLFVFSLLYKQKGHTLGYLSKKLDINEFQLEKNMKNLLKEKIVVKDGNLFSIANNIDFPDVVVKSYEMKLFDIKKALNQAVINKEYTDYSYVVMPIERRKLIKEYKEIFQRCGIGLILVSEDGMVEVIRAKRIKEVKFNKLFSKIKIINPNYQLVN